MSNWNPFYVDSINFSLSSSLSHSVPFVLIVCLIDVFIENSQKKKKIKENSSETKRWEWLMRIHWWLPHQLDSHLAICKIYLSDIESSAQHCILFDCEFTRLIVVNVWRFVLFPPFDEFFKIEFVVDAVCWLDCVGCCCCCFWLWWYLPPNLNQIKVNRISSFTSKCITANALASWIKDCISHQRRACLPLAWE